MYRKPISLVATIANGQTTSGEIELRDYALAAIVTPAALTSTAITFTVSATKGGTYVPLYDSAGNQVSVTVTTSRAYGITGEEADALAAFNFIKLVGGSAEGAARDIYLCLK